jgi:hypothetical protein
MILLRFSLQSAAAAGYFALAIVGAPTLGFSQTIDQQNVGGVAVHYADLNKNGDDFELLQSFTAGITGTLDKVALPVYEDYIFPPPNGKLYDSNVTVTILTIVNDKMHILGSVVIGADSILNISSYAAAHDELDVNASFPLSGAKVVSVIKGSIYYIAVQADRIVSDNYAGNGLSWFATVADYPRGGPYGAYNGSLFPFFYNNYDLEFQTYVAPSAIPEPSTWAMMLVGFAGLAYAGLRASRKRASTAS